MSCTRGIAKKTTMVGVTWSVIRPARAAHSLGIGTGHCCPLRSGEINRKVALPCLSLCRHVTSSRPELGTLTLTQERPGSFARPSSEPEREMPGCRQLARSAGRCTHRCYDCLPAPNPSSGHVDLSVNDLKLHHFLDFVLLTLQGWMDSMAVIIIMVGDRWEQHALINHKLVRGAYLKAVTRKNNAIARCTMCVQ
jgi:hypothetical protein